MGLSYHQSYLIAGLLSIKLKGIQFIQFMAFTNKKLMDATLGTHVNTVILLSV